MQSSQGSEIAMISWLIIIELAGFSYCLGRAVDHTRGATPPQWLKEVGGWLLFSLGCAAVVLVSIASM
jgi:hypothetical protein